MITNDLKMEEPKEEVFCEGYYRSWGRKGIRNKVLVIYTVECCRYVSEDIARHFRQLGYDVDCIGCQSCMVNQVNIRRLLRYATHPNVGAVLAIGHGCEYIRPKKIADFAAERGRYADWFYQQEAGGTEKSFDKGVEIIKGFLEKLEKTERVPVYLSDLVIGAECGGSDFTSGLAGNALVGSFFDQLVDEGGAAIFEELCEGIGLKDYLVSRGINEKVKGDIARTYDKTLDFSKALGLYSIGPGNMDGGLSTIEEKSMGATVKSGSRPISGVLKIGQAPLRGGLYLLDTVPDEQRFAAHFEGSDASDMMDLIASGSHMVLLVTGRGHVVGDPVAPVLKITGNPRTYERMDRDIDFCAADILTGKKTPQQMRLELTGLIRKVCAGQKTHAERLGHIEGMTFMTVQKGDCVVNEWNFR